MADAEPLPPDPADEVPVDASTSGEDDERSMLRQRIAGLELRGRTTFTRAGEWFERQRTRSAVLDTGVLVYERDREAAGTLLGSALALRLFLFFLPLVLFAVGLAGVIGRLTSVDSIGVHGTIAEQVDQAFDQGSTAPWIAVALGLFGMATTGRSLSKALILASALSWQLGGKQKTGVKVVGGVVGLIVGIGLITVLLNRIRDESGVAVQSFSYVAVLGVYVVLWLLAFQTLPRATSDPGASLPGVAIVALTLTGMQAISVLYLPGQFERASNLYGALGVTITTLGWFFILGRVIALAFSLNAVVHERIGTVSDVVFALPGLRALPRRYRWLARYFDLDRPDHDT